MRRFNSGLLAVLALGVLASTATADVAPAPVAKSPVPAATGNSNDPAARPSGTEASPSSPGTVPLQRVVCLNVSLQCFRVASAAPGTSAQGKSLDLRAPDIRTLVSEAELRQRVEEDWQIRERAEEQEVRVEASRPEVYVPGGLASLPWAIRHPTQAWRIFLPVPQAK